MRRLLLPVLTGALVLLVTAVSAGFAGRTGAVTRERNELSHDAIEQAQVLSAYFERASSIILLTAHNPAFAQFYARSGGRDGRLRPDAATVEQVNEALGYLANVLGRGG